MTDRVIARVHIDQAGEMTEEGRKEVADWLRHQADTLEEEGHDYSTNFVARYIVHVKETVNG